MRWMRLTRETSKEAYTKIKDSGLLSKRKWQVYDHVFVHGPVIARDVWKKIAPETSTGSICTRLSELREMGVVKEVGTKVDQATGMTVIEWDVTANLPRKLQKKKTVEDIRLICDMCGRSWPEEKLKAKVKNKQPLHNDPDGQYCFGELSRYKKV